MKFIILVLLLVVGHSTVKAEPALCEQVYNLAEAVMTLRQDGTSISKVMKIVNELPEGARKVSKPMVLDAYSQPRKSVKSNQVIYIDDFSNKYATACYRKLAVE